MSGDNTNAQKIERAYRRLIFAILQNSPLIIYEGYITELETLLVRKVSLDEVKRDSQNYCMHYQGGRRVLVHLNSPLAKKMIADAIKSDDEINKNNILRKYHHPTAQP